MNRRTAEEFMERECGPEGPYPCVVDGDEYNIYYNAPGSPCIKGSLPWITTNKEEVDRLGAALLLSAATHGDDAWEYELEVFQDWIETLK